MVLNVKLVLVHVLIVLGQLQHVIPVFKVITKKIKLAYLVLVDALNVKILLNVLFVRRIIN